MRYPDDPVLSEDGAAILREIEDLAEDVLNEESEAGEGLPPPQFPLAMVNPRLALRLRVLTDAFFYLALLFALLLTVSLLLSQTASGGIGGLRFFIEQTDAMSPAIRRGALLITANRQPNRIEAGDVITFDTVEGQRDSRLTRVVAERLDDYNHGGMTFFRTVRPEEGAEPDSVAVNQTNVRGVKIAAIPGAGYVISVMNAYAAAFAVLAVALCCAALLLRRWLGVRKRKRARGRAGA